MRSTWKLAAALVVVLATATTTFAGGRSEIDRGGFVDIPGLRGFDGVANTTAADVVVRLGDQYSVRASGDAEILEQYEFDVRNGDLRIRRPWRPWRWFGFVREGRVRIEVTMPEIDSITLTGAGDLVVDGRIESHDLSLRTTGAGSIDVRANVSRLDISITGTGDIEFSGSCDDAEFTLTGPGDLIATLDAGMIRGRVTGAGDVRIEGSADRLDLTLTGPGDFDGDAFAVRVADVTVTGAGSAFLSVEQTLEARLTGPGDVVLTGGDPAIDSRTTGVGRVVAQR